MRPSVASSVPDACVRACGVLQERDGCTIVAHYGSVAGAHSRAPDRARHPHAALASGPPIGRGRDRSDLPHRSIGASPALVGIIGPRAARLLAAAGLRGDMPIGAVGADGGDANAFAIMRESQRRYLALVAASSGRSWRPRGSDSFPAC